MGCLIIKNDGIGDLIVASGVISAIGRHFGGNVDLLTCSENREIAEGITPLRDRLYVSRLGGKFFGPAARLGLLIEQACREDKAVLKEIDRRSYQTVIVLRRFITQSSLVIMRRVSAPKRWCVWQFPTNATTKMAEICSRGWKHHHGSPSILSELDYYRDFLHCHLALNDDCRPQLDFCRMLPDAANGTRVALGISGSSTNWSYDNWVELASRLMDVGWQPVLLGGVDATGLAERIVRNSPSVENWVGRIGWKEVADVLSSCQAYIGNDTGMSHLASLVLPKCLGILGGGTFRRFFPWPGAQNQYLIFYGLPCFDCDWECKYDQRNCLNRISPSRVFQYFESVIRGTAISELDLNPVNEDYQLSWRRLPDSGHRTVRLGSRDDLQGARHEP